MGVEEDINTDVQRVNHIPVVPLILEAVCRTTGMGFAAVARVTDKKWVACSVLDDLQFGLVPGGELVLSTTICDEIRQSGEEVIIDNVKESDTYCNHHTPAMYGFQSYISVPITTQNGFFGTLCAIDPQPGLLNTPEIIAMFRSFASLISFYLDTAALLPENLQQQLQRQVAETLRQHLAAVPAAMQVPDARLSKRSSEFVAVIVDSCSRINLLVAELRQAAL
ncbi:MAG: GAF domain-containing protein [Bacteroidota bacterium]